MQNTNSKPIANLKKAITPNQVRKKRVIDFRYTLTLLIIAFTTLSVLAKFNPYFPLDLAITHSIQQIKFPFFAELMAFISLLGNVEGAFLTVSFVAFLALLLKRKKDALFIIISSGGASLIGIVIKVIVGRPRPAQELLRNFPGYLKENSFPSGHVLFFMGFYTFLLFLFYTHQKNIAAKTIAICICITLLILIGISRIYLGAHWFSDTLGSYLIGSIWLHILVYFYHKVKK